MLVFANILFDIALVIICWKQL